MMKKHSDSTPEFNDGEQIKVAGQPGAVERTLEDGRVMVKFDNGTRYPVSPDKVERT
jgi:hypothetical protein